MPQNERTRRLASESLPKLIASFAVPAIIAMLVAAAYNIADQIFIGNSVGYLGNAATNVAYPLSTICLSYGLLIGVGSASNFSLKLGAGKKEEACQIIANGAFYLIAGGLLLTLVVLCFLDPMLRAFGATENVLPYAKTYTSITSIGFPAFIITLGGAHIVRADGSPTFAMIISITGAVLNIGLDALFIFGFGMGIAGAAWATITGQFVSAGMIIWYLFHFKTMRLKPSMWKPKLNLLGVIASLGVAACFNQLAMTAVQIVLNNSVTHYGAMSEYGADIPLAVVGIITKINSIFISFVVGTAQGCQPIFGYNYGAKNYERVQGTLKIAVGMVVVIGCVFELAFQIFPNQITSIFGTGDAEYFRFAERFFRIYMMMTFLNGFQPLTSNFFSSIGKAKMWIFISLTRQVIFLIPLLLLLPISFGIDGILYAGPVADFVAAALCVWLLVREYRRLGKMSAELAS